MAKNRNKYNLRDSRNAKRCNSARLEGYASTKIWLCELAEEIITEMRAAHDELYRTNSGWYYELKDRYIEILESHRREWECLVSNYEELSNGRFSVGKRHTWSKLGKASLVLMAYYGLLLYEKNKEDVYPEFVMEAAIHNIVTFK